jgi:hypothetical protein
MKKIIVVLVLALSVATLVGCSSSPSTPAGGKTTTPTGTK